MMSAPVCNPQPDVDLIRKWLDLLYANHARNLLRQWEQQR